MKTSLRIMMLFSVIVFCSVVNSKLTYASDGWGSFGDNITWNYTESSGLLEIKGTGDMPESDAPWHSYESGIKKVIIGEGITSVSSYLFDAYAWGYQSYYRQLKEVQLPSTIKSIKASAFYECGQLTTINFPNGLEEIGDGAFKNTALTSITIPGTVKEIGSGAFYGYGENTITNLIINEGVQTIGSSCFSGASISNLSLPSSINTIENSAFSNCNNLVSVEIPSNVTKIENYAFAKCSKLRYAVVNAPVDLPFECFGECKALEMVKLGEGVKSIDGSFRNCTSLKAVYVPQTVSAIKDSSFWFWNGPSSLTLYGYTGSAAWDYAGNHNGVNFLDISTADGKSSWDALWTECVNRKETSSNTQNNNSTKNNNTENNSKKTIKTLKVNAKKGKKSITIKTLKGSKIVVTMNKKILKKGTHKTKKITIKNCKSKNTLKLSKKLPKNTKITVRVTKAGYTARSRMMVIK